MSDEIARLAAMEREISHTIGTWGDADCRRFIIWLYLHSYIAQGTVKEYLKKHRIEGRM